MLTKVRSVDKEKIKKGISLILEGIGEDLNREGLKETPDRVANMYEEIFSGMEIDPSKIIQKVFSENHDELILVRDIPLYSICEHHMMPFLGRAHIAYIPNKSGEITGLSKLARVLEVAAKRLQIQERLTTQIAEFIENALNPRGVFVMIEAEHLCMSMRGVKKPGSITVTSALRGLFKENPASRAEVLSLIQKSKG